MGQGREAALRERWTLQAEGRTVEQLPSGREVPIHPGTERG